MNVIHEDSMYYIFIMYPPLANYAMDAYLRGDHEELIDLLFDIETMEEEYTH